MLKVVETFGKYRLLERLAEGGMAEVFKALVSDAQGRDRVVAIKRLHRALSEDMDLAQMLVDEAAVAVQLNHPNIGEVFDLGQIDDQYFLIMEFIEGVDLQRILDELGRSGRRMPLPLVVAVMAEVCSGLHYAHSKNGADGHPLGIVHRDVSPQNIMLSVRGQVKLIDFGIAKTRMRAQQTRAGIIKGKYYYMAPEQAHGHHVDARTDVFAAGMVLYQLVAGRSAYEDVPERELMRAVRMCEFPSPRVVRPDLDPELAQIIERAVERSPQLRWSNAMELQLALNDYHQRKLPRISRKDLVQFIADTTGVRGPDTARRAGDSDETVAMARQAYQASDVSMLFERPEALVYQGAPSEPPSVGLFGPDDEPPRQQPTQSAGAGARGGQAKVYVAGAVVVALLGLIGAGLWLGGPAGGPSPEPTPTEAAATAVAEERSEIELTLESEPSDATVLLDGQTRGSTPLAIGLEPGRTYELELRKPGFRPTVEELVAGTGPMEKTIALQEIGGVVKVASFPPDAVVTIDGVEVGETPVTHVGLSMAEPHEISATRDGQTLTQTVRWDDEAAEKVREVMFEFQKLDAAQAAVELGLAPVPGAEAEEKSPEEEVKVEKPAPKKKKRTRRKRRRRPAPKSKPRETTTDEDFDVWGSESKGSKSAKEEEEGLDLW